VTFTNQRLVGKTETPNRVGSGDFHEKAVKVEFWFTGIFYAE
jgi:hypothetical protein